MTDLHSLRLRLSQQHLAEVEAAGAAAPDAPRRILAALAAAQRGEPQPARTLLAELGESPEGLDPDSRCDFAALCMAAGRADWAARQLDQVLALAPGHVASLSRRAMCHLLVGEAERAEPLLRRAVDGDPQRLPAWCDLADAALHRRDAAGAQAAIDTARALLDGQGPELAPVYATQLTQRLDAQQLRAWIVAGELPQAEHWLDGVVEREKEEAAADWQRLAATLLAQNDRHADAEEVLRRALRRHPRNTELILQTADLVQLMGRPQETLLLLRRATRQDPANARLWLRLSGAALHGAGALARDAAQRAERLATSPAETDDPASPQAQALRLQARLALAQVEASEEHEAEARALFEEVLAAAPKHPGVLRAYGHFELQQGRVDQAIALFEQVTEVDPAGGHASLIGARRFPEDVETLEKLDRAARIPSLEGSVRSGLLLQLAAAWEKRKDYDRAFAYAQEGNRLSKRFLRYDPKQHRQRCARIRHCFSKPLYEHRRGYGNDSRVPVFVLGMPRSGTTLVEQILAGHSRIHGAGELGLVPQVIAGLERWERHAGSGRSYPDCVDDLSADVVTGIAGKLLEQLQEHDPQAAHVVDKLPHNFENVGLIKFLFPNARIISVRRDPRDIAMSNYFTDYQAKHGGMGFAYDLGWIGEQLADHNLLMHHWAQVFPGEILEVRYEDVVENPEAQARRLLEYVGVDWEPQVLNTSELERPVRTASVWQVRQPIYQSSKAKWERYRAHLAPLIAGTNARIVVDPIEMVSLPEPGLLQQAHALLAERKLDEAEYALKKLLHHLPEHAGARYLLGEVYLRKNLLTEAIAEQERALELAPWKGDWSPNLLRAYRLTGQGDKAEALEQRYGEALKRAGSVAPAAELPQAAAERLHDLMPMDAGAFSLPETANLLP